VGDVAKAKRARPAWYVESTADGGAHYGRQSDGKVIAEPPCGREFVPLDYATRKGTVMVSEEPADEAHACGACWRVFTSDRTSFYEIASETVAVEGNSSGR
jgi:hypothetical protein